MIDSSPTWVGPPVSPYAVNWVDRLSMATVMPEQASGAQTYAQYVTAQQTRLNVVYVGANDGMLHGFRSGAYNSDGTFNTSSPNDGVEVLAYMPSALLQTIHSATANLDYANAQYGHNFFVDATPGTGDVFYNNAWHTWVVGGLGAGGSAIFALDVTNPGPACRAPAATAPSPKPVLDPRHRRVERLEHHLRQRVELRPEPRQHLRHAAAAPPARRQLGGDLRQRLRQPHGRCGHLRHADRPDDRGADLLLPQHRARQQRQPERHRLPLPGRPGR